jgi:hypothetical protein
MKYFLTAMTGVLLISCSGLHVGHVVAIRPAILDQASVERVDPHGNGSQIARFLDAHASQRTAGLCQGMQSEELTPSDWCIITESGRAYLVIDYTRDPLGVDGYRIQPVEYRGKNRFYDEESRQSILLEPWPPN